MKDILVLYSTNTTLACLINQVYYEEKHYVWCVPSYEPQMSRTLTLNPPSSNPICIYKDLTHAIKANDRHNVLIEKNKVGLRCGAQKKKEEGVIDENQFQEINWIINAAGLPDFEPLLYVIPYNPIIKDMMQKVSAQDKAGSFSYEYIIPALPRNLFHIIKY